MVVVSPPNPTFPLNPAHQVEFSTTPFQDLICRRVSPDFSKPTFVSRKHGTKVRSTWGEKVTGRVKLEHDVHVQYKQTMFLRRYIHTDRLSQRIERNGRSNFSKSLWTPITHIRDTFIHIQCSLVLKISMDFQEACRRISSMTYTLRVSQKHVCNVISDSRYFFFFLQSSFDKFHG